ncbi:MAG: contractile injection system protein, VgrG/Pvc8 family [Myxococcota bacterium]
MNDGLHALGELTAPRGAMLPDSFTSLLGDQPSTILLGLPTYGWRGLYIARLAGREAISMPFRFDLIAVRPDVDGVLSLEALVGETATLALAVAPARWRLVHGMIAEATLVERSDEASVYHLALVPQWERSRFRRRGRTFVDRTLREIVADVLENRGSNAPGGEGGLSLWPEPVVPGLVSLDPSAAYEAPQAHYRWVLTDESRIDDPQLRDYVVQYNETDFDLVVRLLTEEGISFVFEHESGRSILTLTDAPGLDPIGGARAYPIVPGSESSEEGISTLRERLALRPDEVTMRTYAWPRGAAVLEASYRLADPVVPDSTWYTFPAREEAVQERPCDTPARVLHERFEAERHTAEGTSNLRTLAPGHLESIQLEGGAPADFLVTGVRTTARQPDPAGVRVDSRVLGMHRPDNSASSELFRNTFDVVPGALRFRPAARAGKPRIEGVQPALVTAEEVVGATPEENRT